MSVRRYPPLIPHVRQPDSRHRSPPTRMSNVVTSRVGTTKIAKAKVPSPPEAKLKVVVRRLPLNLPENIFWDSVAPWVNDEAVVWRGEFRVG